MRLNLYIGKAVLKKELSLNFQVPRSSADLLPTMPRSAMVHPPAPITPSKLLDPDFTAEGGEALVLDQRHKSTNCIE